MKRVKVKTQKGWYLTMKRAEKYEEMLGVFTPFPLTGESYNEFYVDTSSERSVVNASKALTTDLLYGINPSMKILFMGHKGSGKSTEMIHVSQKLKNKYEIVNFSIAEEIEIHGLNYIDVIFVIMDQLIQYIIKNRNHIKVEEDILNSLEKYWKTETELEKVITDEGELKVEGSASLSFLKKVSIGGKGILKTGNQTKTVLREKVEPQISRLIYMMNEVIDDINRQLKEAEGRELLVIIEDFDKLELQEAKEIFVLHRKTLLSLNIKMILSFPIYMVYTSDYNMIVDDFDDRILYSMIKVRNSDGTLYQEGRDILKQIVDKRMMTDQLIETEALDFLIDKSGGAIRDLFFLLKKAALYEITKDLQDDRINMEAAKIVTRMLQSEYEKNISSKEQFEKLVEIYRDSHPSNTDMVLSELLKMLAVIEYNGDRWCGVHPVLVDFLREKGEIDDNMEQ